jgi:hypothetical protein
MPSCLTVATCEPTALDVLLPALPTFLCRRPSDSFSLIVALSFSISALAADRSLCRLSEVFAPDDKPVVEPVLGCEASPTDAAAFDAAFETVLAAVVAAVLSSEVLVGTPAAWSFSTTPVAGAVAFCPTGSELPLVFAPIAGAERSAKAEDGAVWRPSSLPPFVNFEGVLSAARKADCPCRDMFGLPSSAALSCTDPRPPSVLPSPGGRNAQRIFCSAIASGLPALCSASTIDHYDVSKNANQVEKAKLCQPSVAGKDMGACKLTRS